jgi:hypothetical protein
MFKRKRKANSTAPFSLRKTAPFRKRTSVTVLDLEGGVARAAQASGQGSGARITRVAHGAFNVPANQKDDPKAVGAALKAALEAAKVKAREVIFALPRGLVVLRPLQVPLVADARELASIINFQISKELPFRIEDAVVDFKVLRVLDTPPAPDAEAGAAPEQRLEVLVGAVKRDVVEFYRAVAREAGLKLEGLGLRPIGHTRFVRQSNALTADSAALVVGLRTDETTLDVIDREKLVFSRVATATFPDHEQGRSAFVQAVQIEAVRSLHGYGGTVRKVLLLGETGLEKEVGNALAAKLSIPAEFPILPDAQPESAGAAAACGLALAALDTEGLALDFENPKKPAVQRNTKRARALVALAAAVVLLLALVGTRMHLVKKRTAVKQQVQLELIDAEKKLPIYKRLKTQNKVVSGWMSEEQRWLDHLAYLSAVLPGADQIYVSAFTTTPQHLIRFSVQARTGELLAELDRKLREAGYEVKPLSITPANDRHGYHFRTTVELSIPKKMKPDLSKIKTPARPADDTPAERASAPKGVAGS